MRLISEFKVPSKISTFFMRSRIGGNKIVIRNDYGQYLLSLNGKILREFKQPDLCDIVRPTPQGYVRYIDNFSWQTTRRSSIVEVYTCLDNEVGRFATTGRFAVGSDGSLAIVLSSSSDKVSVFDSDCNLKYEIDLDSIGVDTKSTNYSDLSIIFMYGENRLVLGYMQRNELILIPVINRKAYDAIVWNAYARYGRFCNEKCAVLASISPPMAYASCLMLFDEDGIHIIGVRYSHLLCGVGRYPLVAMSDDDDDIGCTGNRLAAVLNDSPVTVYKVDGLIQDADVDDNKLLVVTSRRMMYVFDIEYDRAENSILAAAIKSFV